MHPCDLERASLALGMSRHSVLEFRLSDHLRQEYAVDTVPFPAIRVNIGAQPS